jgi:hypothetical protein
MKQQRSSWYGVLLSTLLLGGCASPGISHAWEYKVVRRDADVTLAQFEQQLNELGNAGWILETTTTLERPNHLTTPVVILKRLKR